VGKTTLLRVFCWQVEQAGRRVAWISGDEVAPNPGAILSTLSSSLGVPEPFSALGTGEAADVVVLDAAENLSPCISWVFGSALARSGHRLLIVIASRTALPSKVRSLLGFAARIEEVEVEGFSEDELSAAIRARSLPASLEPEVRARSAASPLAFALLSEHYERTGSLPVVNSAADPWTMLATEFMRSATRDDQATALRALALARTMTPALLGAMLGVDDPLPQYRFLEGLSFVSQTPRGLVLHGLVRRAVFDELSSRLPELRLRFAERAIVHLTACPPSSSPSELLEGMLESFFVGRRPIYSTSTLFLDDLRRHGLRLARESDLGWIRSTILEFEGAASLERFEAVAALQGDRLFVVTNEDDDGAGVIFAVDPAQLPRQLAASDPVLAAALQRFGAEPGFVARWWFARTGWQAFSPGMTAVMVAGAPITAKLPPHRFAMFAVVDPERWEPLAGPFGLKRLPGLVRFPTQPKALYVADLDELAPLARRWEDRASAVLRFHAQSFAFLSEAGPPAWLSREDFEQAVREALTQLRHPLELSNSPLAAAALLGPPTNVSSAVAERLVEAFRGALERLGRSPGYAQDVEILQATYFGTPNKHEAVAADLGMPFGTFRHRLRRAIGRLTEVLWELEQLRRSAR